MFSNGFYWILLDSLRHIISCLGGYWQVRIIERLPKLEHGVLSLSIPKKAEKKLPEKKLIAIEG